MGISLYPHNQAAYDSALSMLSETGKAAVIHPTGTGKSFIGFKLAEEHPTSHICWLSPSEYIYKTQVENLKAASGGYAPENISFLTYAKLMLSDDAYIERLRPDYIILDEFHRCGAAEWGKGVERLLSAFRGIPILGLSATNIRYLDNQRDMADELFDGNVAAEMTLGEAIVRNVLLPPVYITSIYSCQKDLEKYQRKVNKAKNLGIRDAAQKYLDELRRRLAQADGLDVIFDKHIKDRDGKFVVFCANVEHMKEMIELVPKWFGKVDASPHIYSVYAEDSASDKEFAAFKQDDSYRLKLLFCIDMLNEGIHVEDLSGVILFRPTISPIIYKQQIGRALSASKGRQPVIFDIVNNFENLYSIGTIEGEVQDAVKRYREMGWEKEIINATFRVIDRLRDCRQVFSELQDSLTVSWDKMYELAKAYYEEHGDLDVTLHHKTADGLELGKWIYYLRCRRKNDEWSAALSDEYVRSLDEIGMIWDKPDYVWNSAYEAARQYYEEHGDLIVPWDYKSGDIALGSWITRQRRTRSGNLAGTLTKERIQKLDAIGMVWENMRDFKWNCHYQAAKSYYEEHGNLNIGQSFVTEDGIKLGKWLASIRGRRNYGEKTSELSSERIRQLEEIGMVWSRQRHIWDSNYEIAKEYFEEHGHLDVPRHHMVGKFNLGDWVMRMRAIYLGNDDGSLTALQIEKLNAIGMKWACKIDDEWENSYAIAKAYYEEHGNLDVPIKYSTKNGFKLGQWLYRHRVAAKHPDKPAPISLTEERTAKLDAIGMIWDKPNRFELSWQKHYKAATEYYKRNGHLNMTNAYKTQDGLALGAWVQWMRLINGGSARGTLSETHIAQLNAIGMNWALGRRSKALMPKAACATNEENTYQGASHAY